MYDDIPKSEWDTYRPKRSKNGHDGTITGRTIIRKERNASIMQSSRKVQG